MMTAPHTLPYIFQTLTPDQVQAFLPQVSRVIHSQTPDFDPVHRAMGTAFEWVGLCANPGGEVVAAAKVTYLRTYRFFQRAVVNYAPMMASSVEEPTCLAAFLEGLKAHLRQKPRLLEVRVSPHLLRERYEDYTFVETDPKAAQWDAVFKAAGFTLQSDTLADNPSILGTSYYVKPLAHLEGPAQFWKSVSKKLLSQVRSAQRYGVQVRLLTPETFPIYERLMAETVKRTGMLPQHLISYAYEGLLYDRQALYPYAYLDLPKSLAQMAKDLEAITQKQQALQEKAQSSEAAGQRLAGQIHSLECERLSLVKRQTELQALAKQHGEEVPLAVAAFYFTPTDCIYLQSALAEETKSFFGIHAIHEKMVEEAFKRGCQYYNFFYVSPSTDPDVSDASIIAFKRQFNGNLEILLGNYHYLFKPRLIHFLKRLRG